jgi:hypothetical protein
MRPQAPAFDFRTSRHAQKRIGNAFVSQIRILRLPDRMRLTMQKRPRAFLFQIVTANDRFRHRNGHAEVASERISGPPRWVRDVGLVRATTTKGQSTFCRSCIASRADWNSFPEAVADEERLYRKTNCDVTPNSPCFFQLKELGHEM